MAEKVIFTDEMKKDYTVLIPTMLPIHFKLLENIFTHYGYKSHLLTNSGQNVVDSGLKYVHNDACYPIILMVGQFIDALDSGEYDTHKVALLITQTGGGCRASNYIYILRKALERAGYGYIPVLSINFNGLDENSMKFTVPMIRHCIYGIMYGDLLMWISNQCRPYEIEKGITDKICADWVEKLSREMLDGHISYGKVKKNFAKIVKSFEEVPKSGEKKIKVGIVGEIFVKFSPLGNNKLEEFLVSEGAETRMAGLLDFCLYCIKNGIIDRELYGYNKGFNKACKIIYPRVLKIQKTMIKIIRDNSSFDAPTPFEHTFELTEGYINKGVKMGEGWLLPAEMLELNDSGVKNIICVQPFGCLPNHIVGKGMMKPVKDKNPDCNLVAVDYDPSATKINQENRIKLMLSIAYENEKKAGDKT